MPSILPKSAWLVVGCMLGGVVLTACQKQDNAAVDLMVIESDDQPIEIEMQVDEQEVVKNRTYQEMLASGVEPGLPPDYSFPVSSQYKNGCFGFSVGHILQSQGIDFDPYEMEKAIEKPRSDLWTSEHISRLAEEYNLRFEWNKDAETFFDLLVQGEPMVIQYWYPVSDHRSIGHMVAAYSFDAEGVWVSDPLENDRIRLDYEEVFDESGTQTLFGFAQVHPLNSNEN